MSVLYLVVAGLLALGAVWTERTSERWTLLPASMAGAAVGAGFAAGYFW